MKKAFTMVELIIVVVILGILAAAAIPRLNTTRETAGLVVMMEQIQKAINDINAYYVSKGELALDKVGRKVKFREMTNAGVIDSSGNLGFFVKKDQCFLINSFFDTGYDAENYIRVSIGERGLCKKLWNTPEFKQFRQTIKRPPQGTASQAIGFGASRVVF